MEEDRTRVLPMKLEKEITCAGGEQESFNIMKGNETFTFIHGDRKNKRGSLKNQKREKRPLF